MRDDILVKVDNVSKRFCKNLKRSLWFGLQDMAGELTGRRNGSRSDPKLTSKDVGLRRDEFWALKDISFEVKRGECLGLVGRNGAGKTTLLRMLNGLIKPDTGRIEMRGRVGGLIALGAGFNPVLTGRENIFINASVLGFNKQVTSAKIDEIIEFSGIADFIDTPVQNYSSGMQVRLGFAVAAVLASPDIMLLDEVLAVGDAAFHVQCTNTVRKLISNGTAVILVSHNMHELLRYCNNGLYLRNSEVRAAGSVHSVIDRYLTDSDVRFESSHDIGYVPGVPGFVMGTPVLIDDWGNQVKELKCNESARLRLHVNNKTNIRRIRVELAINDPAGLLIQNTSEVMFMPEGIDDYDLVIGLEKLPVTATKIVIGISIWSDDQAVLMGWARENRYEVTGIVSPGKLIVPITYALEATNRKNSSEVVGGAHFADLA